MVDINWDDLPRPFFPGSVLPKDGKWIFTFVSAGNEYCDENKKYDSAWLAKKEMREFIANEGKNEVVKEVLKKIYG